MKTAEQLMRGFEYGYDIHEDIIKLMKLYANMKLDEAANQSQEMLYEREKEYSQKQGLILRNFQTVHATAKQVILNLKDNE